MPTYVYRCLECSHQFEHIEKMSSNRKSRKCPVCEGRAKRQISGGAGFLFKGEGFYITDYRSEAYRSQHKAETEKAETEKAETEKAEPGSSSSAETAAPGPEAVADKTAAKPDAAKPDAAKKRRGGSKKKKR
ncbi:MAG TPA: FmdB family zinc ribbon protein [Gemmatimonadota bacterium]|nr:FmdB family zinc ribbon protein [Gemmatimonadota bacterium]